MHLLSVLVMFFFIFVITLNETVHQRLFESATMGVYYYKRVIKNIAESTQLSHAIINYTTYALGELLDKNKPFA